MPFNSTDFAMLLFTLCNAVRLIAYFPQIVRVFLDSEGAKAISYTTWSLFALANFSTAIYAGVALRDVVVTLIFCGNTLCCSTVVVATAWKRALYSRRAAQAGVSAEGVR